jgi:hypothetical protein
MRSAQRSERVCSRRAESGTLWGAAPPPLARRLPDDAGTPDLVDKTALDDGGAPAPAPTPRAAAISASTCGRGVSD